jgi:hypothetical protein
VKWTGRWIARAQRKADLRTERFVRHEERVRAGTERPGLRDRAESWTTLHTERFVTSEMLAAANAHERRLARSWPLASRPDDASLAEAWQAWVMDGPACGPDGITVTVRVRCGGRDLPFGSPPGQQLPVTWREGTEAPEVYTVCVCRMPAGLVQEFCSFATETTARWYAVELARKVRYAGITALRPSDIFPERSRPARSDRTLAQELTGVRSRSRHDVLWLPRQARARWRQLRTGRR